MRHYVPYSPSAFRPLADARTGSQKFPYLAGRLEKDAWILVTNRVENGEVCGIGGNYRRET